MDDPQFILALEYIKRAFSESTICKCRSGEYCKNHCKYRVSLKPFDENTVCPVVFLHNSSIKTLAMLRDENHA